MCAIITYYLCKTNKLHFARTAFKLRIRHFPYVT